MTEAEDMHEAIVKSIEMQNVEKKKKLILQTKCTKISKCLPLKPEEINAEENEFNW